MSDVIKVKCPECGVSLKVKPRLIGSTRPCPGCQKTITLQSPSEREVSRDIVDSPVDTPRSPPLMYGAGGLVMVGIGLGLGWFLFGGDSDRPVPDPGRPPTQTALDNDTDRHSDGSSLPGSSAVADPASVHNPDQSIFPTNTQVSGVQAPKENTSPGTPSESPRDDSPQEPESNEIPQAVEVAASVPRDRAVVSQPGTPNSIGMVLQSVEAGYYQRHCGRQRPNFLASFTSHASYGGFADENPGHDVVITRPFLIGKTEVTVGQFRQFVEATGYQTTAERSGAGIIGLHGEIQVEQRIYNPLGQRPEFTWKNPGFEQSDNHPVTGVSWDDTQAFCQWLSDKEGATYRLPTEAEWEYACRAGTKTWFYFGDEYANQFHHYANLADGTLEAAHEKVASLQWVLPEARDGAVYTSEVGRYEPNPWGLHDMHGNVWEWCQDVYNDVYYNRFRGSNQDPWKAAVDPVNLDEHTWEPGDFRAIRGGSWVVAPIQSRTGTRGQFERGDAACYLGFRVVREATGERRAEADTYRQKQMEAEETVRAYANHELKFEPAPDHEGSDLALFLHGEPPPPDLLPALPYLSRVRYMRPHGEATPQLIQAIAQMTWLRHVVFSYPQETCPAEEYSALSELEHLVHFQADGSSLTPTVLREFKSLPNLYRLAFGNESIDDEQILQLQGIEFTNLEWLNLRSTTSDGRGLAAFAGAPLKTLYLRTLTDTGAVELAHFPLLTSVTISQPNITRAGLAELGKLKHLERLYLDNLDQLTDDDFASLATMTGLRDLRLNGSGAGDKTAEVISSLLLSNLRIGSPAFTDEGLKHIGNITTLCNELEIGHESRISDDGLSHLWGPARLRSLKLHVFQGITGSGFEAISDMTELRNVEVFSEDFTDTGMRYLGYLPNLTNVTIGHYRGAAKGVTDEGLLMLAEAPSLQRITFTRTGTQVTPEGIARLKERRPNVNVEVREFDQ